MKILQFFKKKLMKGNPYLGQRRAMVPLVLLDSLALSKFN